MSDLGLITELAFYTSLRSARGQKATLNVKKSSLTAKKFGRVLVFLKPLIIFATKGLINS
jgi:hypothetical protein